MNIRSIVKKFVPRGLFRKIEPLGHLAEAVLWNVRLGFPARGLNVIGVTGTDGKTTTSTLIYRALKASGKNVAMLTTSTVDLLDGQGERPSPTHMTTASSKKLLLQLKQIKNAQPDWVVLETSSHALAQHRVFGVPYSIAVITNLSHEHLDYHGTMARYAAAKRRLFRLSNKNKRGLRVGIANADDATVADFAKVTKNPLTYGIDKGDLRASNIVLKAQNTVFTATVGDDTYKITSQLTGRFNVYNMLAALGVLRAIGLDKDQVEQALATAKPVQGRMMRVDAGQPFEVLIDYAVTPAAMENALKALKEVVPGKVGIVFGATGDRDTAKRPVMGEVAVNYADRVYLTDDETYTEDAAMIRNAVWQGIVSADGESKSWKFDDRAKAIKQALKDAKAGDAVLITGLGHQTDRNMGGKLQPWSDEAVVAKIIKG